MTPLKAAEQFARNEYRDWMTYKALAAVEPVPDFKLVLEELTKHEWEDYQFWLQFSERKQFYVSPFEIVFLKFMRRLLGLTFTAKFLERHEHWAVERYKIFLKEASPEVAERVRSIITREDNHEKVLLSRIKEERVMFMGSIVLGLNDGLIELTGALVGFSFALQSQALVALTGFITGIAASMSMASSAYMQARHEVNGKDPKKAAAYTGASYLFVVVLLVLPFLVFDQISVALAVMLFTVFLIILSVSFYTAVLLDRKFKEQFREMLMFSAGVAAISFVIGLAFRSLFGVEV